MSPEMSFAPVRPSGERGWSFSVIPKPRSGDYLTLLLDWFLRWYQSSGASHVPPSPLVLLWCCLILTIWNIFQPNSALKRPYSTDFQIFIIHSPPNDSPKESSYGTLKTAHLTLCYDMCTPNSLCTPAALCRPLETNVLSPLFAAFHKAKTEALLELPHVYQDTKTSVSG